nr:uncharacterized protein LOC129264263 [Lytechinus pictus]
MMRRTRKSSRDSSQDSPVTDNERDIIWGDSPPPRRICLSTTPGRRVTRASAAEQDLTDLIECMHPKENKESSTPPLLGLWMRNRQEPDSEKKKRRPARLARRTTGRKLSRIGLDKGVLDDLRMLTEWTGNLVAVGEHSEHPAEDSEAVTTEGATDPDGGGDAEAMECDNLEDLFADDDLTDNVDGSNMETRQAMKERRKSSNRSFSSDFWDSDDWGDEDSIIRIATQVEKEALTQRMQQKNGNIKSPFLDADMISPSQNGLTVNVQSKMCQNVNQSVLNNGNFQSKTTGHVQTTEKLNNGSSVTRGATGVSKPSLTTLSKAQVLVSTNNTYPPRESQKPSQKPTTMPYRKGQMHTSRSHTSTSYSKAVPTLTKPNTSTHHSAKSFSNVKPLGTKNNVHTNANVNISTGSRQKVPAKASFPPPVSRTAPQHTVGQTVTAVAQAGNRSTTCNKMPQAPARVPPMSDALSAAPVKGQTFNDSLDDLFAGDNSLPDDMLLALLDNDSDFEEYSKKAPSTVPVGSNNSTQKQFLGNSSGNSVAASCKPTMSKPQMHSMSTRAQYSSGASSKSKGANSYTTNKCYAKGPTPKNLPQTSTNQAVGTTHSRLTRSTAQSPVTRQSTNHQTAIMEVKNVSVEPAVQGGMSLSQPVPPPVKEGGTTVQRCCSQQEIEQKRQAALAKRKKSKLRVSPIT